MAKRLAIWAIERAMEMLLAAATVLFVYGPSNDTRFTGVLGELYIATVAVSFFYIASGYVFTTLFLRVFARPRRLAFQVFAMTSAFVAHFLLFLVLSDGGLKRAAMLVSVGVCIVALSTLLGGTILGQAERRQNL